MSKRPVATDQLLDTSKLSRLGRYLVEAKDEIIAEFEKRIRAEVGGAKSLDLPVLVDTLPAFLDSLAEALTPDYPRTYASEFSTIAQEHGGERARLTHYNLEELIREYQIVKDVLFDHLASFNLSRDERLIINNSIDEALRGGVTSFALIQSDLREQFVATLSHDLRNPLSVIKMAAELTYKQLDDKAAASILLTRIIDNAKQADRLIQNLLDAAAIKTGARLQLKIEKCNMLDLVKDVIRSVALVHGDRFTVVGESVEGYWSPEEIKRAVENLCTNAVKYGELNTPITIQIASQHRRVFVSVHNSGPPIPVEEQEAIFQIYRRAEAAKQNKQTGWGLGLPLVRGVAESHGGSVLVDSAEGRGTTFMIDIPVDSRPLQNAPVSGGSVKNN